MLVIAKRFAFRRPATAQIKIGGVGYTAVFIDQRYIAGHFQRATGCNQQLIGYIQAFRNLLAAALFKNTSPFSLALRDSSAALPTQPCNKSQLHNPTTKDDAVGMASVGQSQSR